MSKTLNLRAHAAKILTSLVKQQQSLASVFPYQQADFSAKDEALLQELCFGVCRWYHHLTSLAGLLLDKPLRAKDTDVNILLLLGLYQLEFTRIPAHAAISETVQACKQLKKASASGLINAILRRSQREQASLRAKLADQAEFLHSHPQWLLNKLQQAWPEHWQGICAANNARAPMTLRVNTRINDRESYLDQLQQAQITATPGPWSQQGIYLDQPTSVDHLPGFDTGNVSVQDEAAQLAAHLLQLEPGMRVLDACAAPGGKTCHILETEPALSAVVALELDGNRAVKIHQNLGRLGLEAEVIEGDASAPEQWWDNTPFDRILLDAPCSATGVIRRHPDIKLLRREEDIPALAQLQLQILKALWSLLKPHGILLYATCSVLPEENEQVIASFIEQQQDACLLKIDTDWGLPQAMGRQLLPQQHAHDGFYYARLQKQ